MGNYIMKLLFRHKDTRILILGLDAAGKTSSLYKLKLGEIVTTIPTIGFNVETLTYKGLRLTAWDVGGRDKIRPLYRHYYQNTDAVICVIDSNDRERLDDAIQETIERTSCEDELRDAVYLVLANKQDLPGAMSPKKITEVIQNKGCLRRHMWNVFGTSAVSSNDGLYEALDWLTSQITNKQKARFAKTLAQSSPLSENEAKTPEVKEHKDESRWFSFKDWVGSFKTLILKEKAYLSTS